MSITSSIYVMDAYQQQGGGRYVIERHTGSDGKVYEMGPILVPDGSDIATMVAIHAMRLADSLAEAEAEWIVNGT